MSTTATWPEDKAPSPQASRAQVYQFGGVSVARWLVILVVSIIGGWAAGFRWFGEGPDFGQYIAMYEIVGRGFWELVLRYEPGFMAAIVVFKGATGLPFQYFAAGMVTLSLILKQYLFHKYTRYASLATIAYLLLLYPLHEYTQIRVAIGLGLGFWGVHLALERRWLFMSLCFAVGFTFHYTVALIPAALIPTIFLRDRLRVAAVGAVCLPLLLVGGSILVPLFYDIASRFNPLSDSYVLSATKSLDEVNLFSVSNLALYGALASAFCMPWFSRDSYRRTFAILSMGSVVAMVLFSGTPVFAQRLREVLLLSFIFFAYRDARNEVEWIPGALVLFASAVAFYSSISEGIIEFG